MILIFTFISKSTWNLFFEWSEVGVKIHSVFPYGCPVVSVPHIENNVVSVRVQSGEKNHTSYLNRV